MTIQAEWGTTDHPSSLSPQLNPVSSFDMILCFKRYLLPKEKPLCSHLHCRRWPLCNIKSYIFSLEFFLSHTSDFCSPVFSQLSLYFFYLYFAADFFTGFLYSYPIFVLLYFQVQQELSKSKPHIQANLPTSSCLPWCYIFLGFICIYSRQLPILFFFSFFPAEILNVIPNLEVLDLSINKLIGYSMKVIAQALKNVPGLKELNLHICGLKQDNLQGLGQTLCSERLSF